jgi:hypothetical protein
VQRPTQCTRRARDGAAFAFGSGILAVWGGGDATLTTLAAGAIDPA